MSSIGDLVFGRMPTALYLGKPDYRYEPDESKWRILPDMHEALVSRGDFYAVREKLEAHRCAHEQVLKAGEVYRKKHPPLFKTGIVRCGCCGSSMTFVRQRKTNDGRYNCQYKQYGRCSNPVCISESKIAPVVWNAVQTQLAMFADFEAVTERLKSNPPLHGR